MILRQIWAIRSDGEIDPQWEPFESYDIAQQVLAEVESNHPEEEHEIVTSHVADWEKVPNA